MSYKYLKYKNKYLDLKKSQLGGSVEGVSPLQQPQVDVKQLLINNLMSNRPGQTLLDISRTINEPVLIDNYYYGMWLGNRLNTLLGSISNNPYDWIDLATWEQ